MRGRITGVQEADGGEMQDKKDYCLREKGKRKEPKEMRRAWSYVRP